MLGFADDIYENLGTEAVPCTVYAICCNDAVEYAVVNDENLAKEEMAKLKIAYFEKNKWHFKDEESYNAQCYWCIRKVNGTYVHRS